MSLLPTTASLHERVQDCFVAFRGRGVSLSSADLELVDAWAQQEVPFPVIARGIRRAAEIALFDAAKGESGLRSLRACRRQVESEISKYLKRSAGKTQEGDQAPAAFHLLRHKKLKATMRRLAKAEASLAPMLLKVLKRLPAPRDFETQERQEDLVCALLVRNLPPAQRVALEQQAQELVGRIQAMSPGARRRSLRSHRSALVRAHLRLQYFW